MKSKVILYILIWSMILIFWGACNKKPQNVRELMNLDGWEFCGRISTDGYFIGDEYQDPYIREDSGQYDLFRRDNEYALTITCTDTRSLLDYDSEDDHLKSSYWINYYAVPGDYSVRAKQFGKKGTNLRTLSKHYTGMASTDYKYKIYFIIPDQQSHNHENATEEEVQMSDGSEVIENNGNYSEEEIPTRYVQCTACYGTTRCGACGGSGMVYNAIDYSPGQYVNCSVCNGSGICGLCGGTGQIEEVSWQ